MPPQTLHLAKAHARAHAHTLASRDLTGRGCSITSLCPSQGQECVWCCVGLNFKSFVCLEPTRAIENTEARAILLQLSCEECGQYGYLRSQICPDPKGNWIHTAERTARILRAGEPKAREGITRERECGRAHKPWPWVEKRGACR